jgi:ATP-dependent DNA helicase RecG
MVVFYGERKGESYDGVTLPDADINDIDSEAINLYRRLRGKANPSAEELQWNDDDLLRSLSAVKRVDGVLVPTVTGILLFGSKQALRRIFPMMRVDYIRVPGKEWIGNPDERFSTIDMRGPLLQLVQRVQSAITDDLPKGFVLPEGHIQAQSLSLSSRVLREAIVNALMHRSYKTHSPVQVIRYSNRLEIINPGYSLKAEERLGEPGSENRNPHISAIFHETNTAETKGSGIKTMRRLMEEANFAPPTFDSDRRGNRFIARLLLQHFLDGKDIEWLANFNDFNLNEQQKKGLIFLRETGALNNASYRQLNGVDTYSASKDLRGMRASGLLDMKGQSSATYYIPGSVYDLYCSQSTQGGYPPVQRGGPPFAQGDTPLRGKLSESLAARISSITDNKNRITASMMEDLIVDLCKIQPLSSRELSEILGRTQARIRDTYLNSLIKSGRLIYTIPEMPYHSKQAYIANI